MRAIVISRFGGPEVLELREVDTPEPGRGEVRVRVRATAVNRADLLQRMGQYPAPPDAPADVPGLEFAGEVDAVGPGVSDLRRGERVFGLCGGGGYAEALVVHARTVARMPATLSFSEAAAVPEAFITAWDALVSQAGLGAGEVALVHAGGSGVGTAALQIARAVGARAVATVRSSAKRERLRGLGAESVIVVENEAFAPAVTEALGGAGADVILELVGGAYLAQDLVCAASRARIVLVGLMAGARAELDLGLILRKRLSVTGTVLRSRPLEEKIAATQAFVRHLVPLFERRALAPVIDRLFPLAEAAAAHRHVASNQSLGKVVLEV